MFLDLQGFIVNKKFIVKEVAMLKRETILTHYIFYEFRTKFLEIFDKIRQVLHFLVDCTMDCNGKMIPYNGIVPYNEMKRLITMAIFEDDVIVYVKGHEKRDCELASDNENTCTSKPWMQFTKTWNLYLI